MCDVRTRFCAAIDLRRASASASVTGPGSGSGPRSRMPAGTIASISAARDGYPSTASIAAWSSGDVPMCRAANPAASSSAASPFVPMAPLKPLR